MTAGIDFTKCQVIYTIYLTINPKAKANIMDPAIAKALLMAGTLDGLGSPKGSMRNKPDPSTRKRKEVCPNCEEEHENNKHLYCTKKCAKEAGKI